MKVALCFYGQPRHLDNPYTRTSLKHFIIDRYNADVFIHSWISGEEKQFDYPNTVKNRLIYEKEPIDAEKLILSYYKPKKYLFEKPINFSLENETREKIIKYTPINNAGISHGNVLPNGEWNYNNENNFLSQLYSLSQSIRLLNDDYDWIVVTRLDLYLTNFPNLYQLNSNILYLDDLYPTNFTDTIFIGKKDKIERLDCYDRIDELSEKIRDFTPEEYKYQSFREKFTYDDLKKIHIGAGVVRTNSLHYMEHHLNHTNWL